MLSLHIDDKAAEALSALLNGAVSIRVLSDIGLAQLAGELQDIYETRIFGVSTADRYTDTAKAEIRGSSVNHCIDLT